ncbi:MAG: peptidylprolyl isomerase [Bacteroidota bacterium]
MSPRPLLYLMGLVLLISLSHCYLPQEEVYAGIKLDLKDPLSQSIIDFQDQQKTDSLLVYLSHPNPTYRFLAARAFGSFVDKTAVDSLSSLLQDPFDLVREMAAYALGQQGDERAIAALTAAFTGGEEANLFQRSNGAILEAVGRLGAKKELTLLADISTYDSADTSLISGQARAILRMGLRDVHSRLATNVQVEIATNTDAPFSARLPAATYLARYAPILTNDQQAAIVSALNDGVKDEATPLLAAALARLGDESVIPQLRTLCAAADWRIPTQIFAVAKAAYYPQLKGTARQLLKGKRYLASIAAGEFFLRAGQEQDATGYAQLALDSLSGQSRYLIYAAAQRHLPYYLADYRAGINYQLQQQFEQEEDPVIQAAILTALAEFPWNYRIIHNLGFGHPEAVVRTAAVSAIGQIATFEDFADFFTVSQRRVRTEISVYLREAISSEDAGMIAEAAAVLKETAAVFRPYYEELEWAKEAQASLVLPRDTESYRSLDDAIALLEGRSPIDPHPSPVFNRPIDWSVLDAAGTDPVIRLRTTRGNISLRLFPEAAPATVASFIQLVNEGYYNGKPFHRVVPAWVAQGGCSRGDGYGNENFSLRTETPPLFYDGPGKLGMASAGPDTEGVQFFITHGPASQLDGRYTLFGEVLEGQEVVNQLQLGDLIERAELR